MSEPILRLRGVAKEFTTAGQTLKILRDVDLAVDAGETLAVQGPSGSGKSTLLGLMAGLERPTSGEVLYEGRSFAGWTEEDFSRWRSTSVGFIFQNFRLVESLTALENVALPLEIQGRPGGETEERAREALRAMRLEGREEHFPVQLSGGEQQRVAIARAFVHRPDVIFADEPTGSLDRETARAVLDGLLQAHTSRRCALVLVTHDPEIAVRMRRTYSLEQGAYL